MLPVTQVNYSMFPEGSSSTAATALREEEERAIWSNPQFQNETIWKSEVLHHLSWHFLTWLKSTFKQSVLPSSLPSARRCNLKILTPSCPNKMLHSNSPYCCHWIKIDLGHEISNWSFSLFSHCMGEKFRVYRSGKAYHCTSDRSRINVVKVRTSQFLDFNESNSVCYTYTLDDWKVYGDFSKKQSTILIR